MRKTELEVEKTEFIVYNVYFHDLLIVFVLYFVYNLLIDITTKEKRGSL
jgi:hypothetical protein